MTDEDIHAFQPVPPAPPARRRRHWPWLLAGLVLLGALAAAAMATAWLGLSDAAQHGLHVQIDGDDWNSAFADGDRLQAHWGLALAGVILALTAVFVVVTVVVPTAVLLALLAAALGIGVVLLAVLAVAAVVLSPLWALALLLWLALRPRRIAA